jgi:hypothetical protein
MGLSAATHPQVDLLLVKPDGADRYVELRDVRGGWATRSQREDCLAQLFVSRGRAASRQVGDHQRERATTSGHPAKREHAGAGAALRPRVPRFEFGRPRRSASNSIEGRHAGRPMDRRLLVNRDVGHRARERKRPTTIRHRPAATCRRAGASINPATGAVLISELVIEGGGVNAIITVSYQSEPLMGLLVPVAMHESASERGAWWHCHYGRSGRFL